MTPSDATTRRLPAQIVENAPITAHVRRLVLRVDAGLDPQEVTPGRFFLVQVSESTDPFLSRPFSIGDLPDVHTGAGPLLEFAYHVRGRGTEHLATRREGDTLHVLGPLGNGFEMGPDDVWHLMIAGGIGAAPFPLLARRLNLRGARTMYLVGGRTAEDVLFVDRMKALGARVMQSTDDGSLGTPGTVLSLLERFLENPPEPDAALSIYACGPEPMLRAVAAFLQPHGHDAQLSLEARMACGVGACQGCAVELKPGEEGKVFKRACIDGPIFRLSELV